MFNRPKTKALRERCSKLFTPSKAFRLELLLIFYVSTAVRSHPDTHLLQDTLTHVSINA